MEGHGLDLSVSPCIRETKASIYELEPIYIETEITECSVRLFDTCYIRNRNYAGSFNS